MADKRPLCLYSGRIEELRSADTLLGGRFVALGDAPSAFPGAGSRFRRMVTTVGGDALAWHEPGNIVVVFADCTTSSNSTYPLVLGSSGSGASASGGANNDAPVGTYATHLLASGWGKLFTGSSSTGQAHTLPFSSNPAAWLYARFNEVNWTYFETAVILSEAPNATDTYWLYFETRENNDAANTSVGFRLGGTLSPLNRWYLRSAAGGTETLLDTGVNAAADTIYRLSVLYDRTSAEVRGWINGTSIGTITTNVPSSSSARLLPILRIEKTAGTTSRSCWFDYFLWALPSAYTRV